MMLKDLRPYLDLILKHGGAEGLGGRPEVIDFHVGESTSFLHPSQYERLNIGDVFDVVPNRDDLPAFLVRHRDVCHEAFNQHRFPNLFLGRERVPNLSK